jgi:membrane protease YdiL (CAAX protease family)
LNEVTPPGQLKRWLLPLGPLFQSMLSKKVRQFILLTFLISWSVALAAYLLNVQYGSILSFIILAVLFMPGPAYATLILQKLVYRETLTLYGFTLKNLSWRWLLITTVGFAWFIVLGTFVVIGILGNRFGVALLGRVDFSEAALLQQVTVFTHGALGKLPPHVPIPPVAIFLLSLVQGVVAGFTVSLPFTFGEELGWRGLLLRETQSWGFVRSNLFIGVVWGLWHAPIIAQGLNYPGHLVAGIFMMTLFTTTLSFPMAYCRLKSRTILGPSALHGMLNAIGPLTAFFVVGANPLFGFVAGIAGIAITLLLAIGIYFFDKRFIRDYQTL